MSVSSSRLECGRDNDWRSAFVARWRLDETRETAREPWSRECEFLAVMLRRANLERCGHPAAERIAFLTVISRRLQYSRQRNHSTDRVTDLTTDSTDGTDSTDNPTRRTAQPQIP